MTTANRGLIESDACKRRGPSLAGWGLAIGLTLNLASLAAAQSTSADSFRAYSVQDATAAQAAAQLQTKLSEEGLKAEVVADAAGSRLLISGPAEAHSIAAQVTRPQKWSVKPERKSQARFRQTPELKAYPFDGDLTETVTDLRSRFAGRDDIRIGMDQRTRQILVHGPAAVHDQITAILSQHREPVAEPRARTPNQPELQAQAPVQTRPAARPQISSQNLEPPRQPTQPRNSLHRADARLRHVNWQQFVAAVEGISPNRLTLSQATDSHQLMLTLPSKAGPTQMRIDPQSGQFQLEGSESLVRSWLQAIKVIDQSRRAANEGAKMMPVGSVKPATITRAVSILQAARRAANASPVRWGGDVVGIEGRSRLNRPAVEGFAERKTDNLLAQAEDAPRNADEGVEGEQPEVEGPGQPARDGGLTGPVQIEFVEGLDSILIRGSPADVARVMRLIDEIEKMSIETEPAVKLVELQHVSSQSMAELVTQLNTESLAARRGSVSVTALIKPNAVLLIGREEAVNSTTELIQQLDQPVAPSSQLKIFRLQHLSATDAQLTMTTFFAERGGLGPRILAQADFRSNALIVYASQRDMAEVELLLDKIDVATSEAVDEVRVFKLKNALAEELAPVLEQTLRGDASLTGQRGFGAGGGQAGTQLPLTAPQAQGGAGAFGGQQGGRLGMSSPRSSMLTLTLDEEGNKVLRSGILSSVRVAADVRANSLVVTAPRESMPLIRALVEQLDELPTSEASIKVFEIEKGDAPALAEMLTELFGDQATQQDGPALQSATGEGESSLIPLRFSVDFRTNSIIATGSEADLGVVEAILLRLDADDVSQRRSRVYRLQNAPAQNVADAINAFLQTERDIQQVAPEQISPFEQIEREVIVVPEVVSNSLIISSTPRYFDAVREIVDELDERPPMVLIQVLIAEVALGNTDEFGVELGIQDSLLFDRSVAITDTIFGDRLAPGFNFNNQQLGNSSSAPSLASREKTAGQALTHFALQRTSDELGYGGLVLSASSESVNLLIRALREQSRLDILSRPQVMTLNNQPAFILVGQRVPYIQGLQVINNQTITPTEFENVGLLLGVTPRISPDGLVVMEIDAEKSQLSEGEGVAIGTDDAGNVITQPPIDTTLAQTTVSARSGQTVILGGLITKSRQTTSRRVPYLSDIPLLGELFRYDSNDELRTELLIIMTPHIVRKQEESDLLNQIESERMSWCLADVIDVHGDVQLSSGGFTSNGVTTELVYPDLDPSGTNPIRPGSEEVPTPATQLQGIPAESPTSPDTLDRSGQRSRRLARRSEVASSSDATSDRDFTPLEFPVDPAEFPVDRPSEGLPINGPVQPLEPPVPEAASVSPVEYVAPASKPNRESTWKKIRKKLPFSRRGKS